MSWRWTDDEVSALEEYYNAHGPDWDGWDEILPQRTYDAILHKAWSLGLRCDSRSHVHNYGREPTLSAELAVAALDDTARLRLALVLGEV